jgi:ABC-2 type transport system permease protein
MWSICKKELQQFFSSLTGYVTIVVFLLLNGLFLFVFPDTNLFDYGYASLETFFQTAPWIFLFLVPAITMRSFADEFRNGTFETLRTSPISLSQLVLGKYIASIIIVIAALIPTLIYVFTISQLSTGGIDTGGIIGSYIGLLLLSSLFVAIGIFCSSATNNAVVAFLVSAFACFVLYFAFSAISKIAGLQSGADYYLEFLGVESHYKSTSRGVLDIADILYFFTSSGFFLLLTARNLLKR